MPLFSNTSPGSIRRAAVLALVAMAAGGGGFGCASKRPKFEMPPDATPEARAAQVTKAEAMARDAQRYEIAGQPDEALKKYAAAIDEYPDLPVAWNNLGVLLAKQGRNLDAAEAYKTASELSPTDPTALYNLGALWEQLGYLDDAARWYDEALRRDPNFLPALERAVLVDDLRSKFSLTTEERLKAAILMERQPWWINRFKRIQQRMSERPMDTALDDHVRTDRPAAHPSTGPAPQPSLNAPPPAPTPAPAPEPSQPPPPPPATPATLPNP